MIRVEKNDLIYYRFESFEPYPELVHGAFTCHGGVSRGTISGLNLGFGLYDREENVAANLGKASSALGMNGLAIVGQVHGDQALLVRAADGYRPRTRAAVRGGYDAMITPDAGVSLMIQMADCQGVLLYHPRARIMAVVHSGWRGSVADILGKTVRRLEREFGADPDGMIAGIGPSLGPCCAEFIHWRDELPEEFHPFEKNNHFDFWAISTMQLTRAGLRPENIEPPGICTKCGKEGFYSYRGQKTKARSGLIAGIKPFSRPTGGGSR